MTEGHSPSLLQQTSTHEKVEINEYGRDSDHSHNQSDLDQVYLDGKSEYNDCIKNIITDTTSSNKQKRIRRRIRLPSLKYLKNSNRAIYIKGTNDSKVS